MDHNYKDMILPAVGSIIGAVVARQLTVTSTRNALLDIGLILGLTGAGFMAGVALSTMLN